MTHEDVAGTYPKGYNWHRRTGVPACPACKAAKAEYQRTQRAMMTPDAITRRTDYASARHRALTRLGQAFPEHYAALLAEELDRSR